MRDKSSRLNIDFPLMNPRLKDILVIDDEEMLCETLKDILQEEGYSVRTAVTALSGLAEIEKNTPDLIISDIKLPDINGIELLKRVKQEYPRVEIILMTAFCEAETYLQAKEKGAFDYLPKPINIPILKMMVSKVLCMN